jgi:hypothetical protein
MVKGPDDLIWIIVPEMVWTSPEELPRAPSLLTLPFDMGVAENRRDRQRRERARLESMWRDRLLFGQLVSWP